ncbi:MAG: EamA family transporter [Bacillota bacterium]
MGGASRAIDHDGGGGGGSWGFTDRVGRLRPRCQGAVGRLPDLSGGCVDHRLPLNWTTCSAADGAVFPTIFGHTLFNWALKYAPPAIVSMSIVAEPVGATLLTWLIWRTGPGPVTLVGGILMLIGIGLFRRAITRT